MIKEATWRRCINRSPVRRQWLWHFVRGYFNYKAVPANFRALGGIADRMAKRGIGCSRDAASGLSSTGNG